MGDLSTIFAQQGQLPQSVDLNNGIFKGLTSAHLNSPIHPGDQKFMEEQHEARERERMMKREEEIKKQKEKFETFIDTKLLEQSLPYDNPAVAINELLDMTKINTPLPADLRVDNIVQIVGDTTGIKSFLNNLFRISDNSIPNIALAKIISIRIGSNGEYYYTLIPIARDETTYVDFDPAGIHGDQVEVSYRHLAAANFVKVSSKTQILRNFIYAQRLVYHESFRADRIPFPAGRYVSIADLMKEHFDARLDTTSATKSIMNVWAKMFNSQNGNYVNMIRIITNIDEKIERLREKIRDQPGEDDSEVAAPASAQLLRRKFKFSPETSKFVAAAFHVALIFTVNPLMFIAGNLDSNYGVVLADREQQILKDDVKKLEEEKKKLIKELNEHYSSGRYSAEPVCALNDEPGREGEDYWKKISTSMHKGNIPFGDMVEYWTSKYFASRAAEAEARAAAAAEEEKEKEEEERQARAKFTSEDHRRVQGTAIKRLVQLRLWQRLVAEKFYPDKRPKFKKSYKERVIGSFRAILNNLLPPPVRIIAPQLTDSYLKSAANPEILKLLNTDASMQRAPTRIVDGAPMPHLGSTGRGKKSRRRKKHKKGLKSKSRRKVKRTTKKRKRFRVIKTRRKRV